MRLRRLTLSFLLGTSFTASGQAFSSSPSQWRKPQITVSPEQRISLAANAIQETMNIFNQTSGQFNVDGNYVYSGVFYGQMADFDLATNGTRFKDLLMTYFLKAEALNPGFLAEFLQFGVMYGWAAVRAYSAYHESAFLGFAERSWGSMRLYTLSNNDVAAGKSPRKSVQVLKDCSGASLSGGTFYIRDDKSSTLSGLPTGLFLTLSALLAEATGNQTYFEAASETLNFFHSQLYNDQLQVVQDTIDSDSCKLGTSLFPYNSALMIEGMAIMATISQNASIVELLRDTVTGSMYSKAWHDDNGINSRGDDKVGDWYTIRAFSAVYHRNVTDPDLRSQIREYLGVQYNALLDFARVPGSDIYGDSWTVAPGPGFVVDSSKQTAALPVLISAISLRNETNTTDNDLPTSTSTTSTTTTPSIKSSSTSGKSHLTTGAIAGTVVGGTTFLIGAGIGIWILLRRRRHLKKHLHSVTPYPIGTRDNKNPESRMRKISRPDLAKRQMITQHQSSQPSNQARTERTELSTEQLLRLLSSRLEAGRSEVGEMPPEYTSESSEWAR